MNYKVGDQIRIRPDLTQGIAYGDLEANDGMCALKGNTCTISSQICDTYCKLEGCDYLWTEEMLEPNISVQNELIKELNLAKFDKETLHQLNDEINNSVSQMQDEFATICKIIFEYGNKIKALSENVSKITSSTSPQSDEPTEEEKEAERLKTVLDALLTYMNKK